MPGKCDNKYNKDGYKKLPKTKRCIQIYVVLVNFGHNDNNMMDEACQTANIDLWRIRN